MKDEVVTVSQTDSLLKLDCAININKTHTVQPSLKPYLIAAIECKTSAAALKALQGLHAEKFDPPVEYSCDLGGIGNEGARIINVTNCFLKELVKGSMLSTNKNGNCCVML